MALHPVGPLPASTYWRRRLVLGVLLVVLVLVVRSCAAGGGGKPTAEARPTSTPTATPTHAAPSPTPVVSATPAPVGACADGALSLTVRTDLPSYATGTSPRFTLTVKNTSPTSCRRDLGGGAVEVLVYSGPDRIWSSSDCSTDKGSAVQLLRAGQVLETSKLWMGKRSAPGCPSPSTQPVARSGTYTVRARLGTLQSALVVFTIHG